MSRVPYRLTRLGVIMSPDPADPHEVEGVLNPGSARDRTGRLVLFPRLVARGNVSRVGFADVVVRDGTPVGVERRGVVLAPDLAWERSATTAGVEDPRITWLADLGRYVMTYVAYGPVGPRPALAVSTDLRTWRRLGPLHFRYEPALAADLNLIGNKDVVLFPEPVPGPDGEPAWALLHRPSWDTVPGGGSHVPAGVDDLRPSIWISYVSVADVARDPAALTSVHGHRPVAGPAYKWEAVKIGAGPPPIRVPEGWLLLHHGVSAAPGAVPDATLGAEKGLLYSAGAMLLDPADPSRVLTRSEEPLLTPETEHERTGTVNNVVFPTAIERLGEETFVFYGMADAHIGVARLERDQPHGS